MPDQKFDIQNPSDDDPNDDADHSKWDLVGYSGGSPGLENAVKRWSQPIGPICFSVYFDASP